MTERAGGFPKSPTGESLRSPVRWRESRIDRLTELQPFWRTVYGEAPGLLGLFSGRRDGVRLEATREIYFLRPNGVHHAAAWVADEVAASRDVYQCAHLLTRPRRRKQYAAPLWSLYADLDCAQLPVGTPPPSVVVESSPGRWQCYWPLTESVDPFRGEDLNQRLAYTVGADRSGWDLTQLLRLPQTPNRKHPDEPLVRLLQRSDVRLDPRALEEQLPPVATKRAPVSRSETSGGPDALVISGGMLTGAARRIWTGESVKQTADGRLDRSASLVRIARVLAGMGVSHAAIVAALAERDSTLGWRKYTDRDDATQQYERIAVLVHDR